MDMLINSLKSNNYKLHLSVLLFIMKYIIVKTTNAETIHKNLAPKYPSISLATVYKSSTICQIRYNTNYIMEIDIFKY